MERKENLNNVMETGNYRLLIVVNSLLSAVDGLLSVVEVKNGTKLQKWMNGKNQTMSVTGADVKVF